MPHDGQIDRCQFRGEQNKLNQAIMDTKEEMFKVHKLNLEKKLKLEGLNLMIWRKAENTPKELELLKKTT